MKQLASNYSISGSTVTLTGVNVPLSQILLVSDATSGNVLYSMAGPAASSYTQAANSAITLASAPGASDKLTIYYDDGVASSNAPSSVSVSNFPSTQTVSGTVTANVQGGNATAVKVDGSSAIQLGSGVVTATTQRVTLATDGPEVTNSTAIKNSVANIPAKGTATIANSTPVNIASDQTVPVSLASVPSHAVTNAGTFAVQNTAAVVGGNATAVKVDGSAVTQPVSLASVPSHAVTNAGTFAVQPSAGDLTSGSAKTQIVNGANTMAVDSSGAVTVNNAPSVTYTYNATGAITASTVLIGPITCSNIREFAVEISSIGTSGSVGFELSNDNTNWYSSAFSSVLYVYSSNATSAGIYNVPTNGALYFRARLANATTAGTTNLVATGLQQPTQKLIQSVNIQSSSIGNLATSNVPLPANYAGFSSYHSLVSAATTNATLVKNSNGTIGTLILTNNSASWAYFKLCNSTTAPTPGTTTAVINIGVAPNSTLDCSASFAGLRMSTGVAYYVSAGTSLTDNTALGAAGTFLVNMTYV